MSESLDMVAVGSLLLFSAVLVILFGSFGLVLLLFLGLVAVAIGLSRSPTGRKQPSKVNCPDCGSPNEPERGRCHYCEEPLPTAEPE